GHAFGDDLVNLHRLGTVDPVGIGQVRTDPAFTIGAVAGNAEGGVVGLPGGDLGGVLAVGEEELVGKLRLAGRTPRRIGLGAGELRLVALPLIRADVDHVVVGPVAEGKDDGEVGE